MTIDKTLDELKAKITQTLTTINNQASSLCAQAKIDSDIAAKCAANARESEARTRAIEAEAMQALSRLQQAQSVNKPSSGTGSIPVTPPPIITPPPPNPDDPNDPPNDPVDPPIDPTPNPQNSTYGAAVYHFGGTLASDHIGTGKANNWAWTGFDGVEVQSNMGGVLDKFRVISNQAAATTAGQYTTARTAFAGYAPYNDGTWKAMVRRVDVARTGPSFQWHNTTHRTKRATNLGIFAADLETFCSTGGRNLKRVICLDTEYYASYVGTDGVTVFTGVRADSAGAVAWAASTAKVVGNVVTYNGTYYVVTTAGTTGTTAPTHTEGAASNGTTVLTVAAPEVFRYSGGTLSTAGRTQTQVRDDVRATGLSDATAIWTNCPTAEVYFSLGLVAMKNFLGETGNYTTDRYGLLCDYIDGFLDYKKSLTVGTTAYNNCYIGDINEGHYDCYQQSVTRDYIDDYISTANGNSGQGIQRGYSRPRVTDWADHYGIDLSIAPASYAYTSTRAATTNSTTLLVSQTPESATFNNFHSDRKRVWFPEAGIYDGVGRSVVVSGITADGEGGSGTVGAYTCASAVSCDADSFVGILHPQQVYTAIRQSRLTAARAVWVYGTGGGSKPGRTRFSFCVSWANSGFKLFPAAYKRAIEAAKTDAPFTEIPAGYTAPTFEAWGTTIWSKITRDERRKTNGTITNMTKFWDGTTIKPPKTGRNAVQKFQVVIEAGSTQLSNVGVFFNKLKHDTSSYEIRTEKIRYGEKLDDGTLRPIRQYNTQYKKIKGISTLHYNYFESAAGGAASSENLLQPRFRAANKLWASRPDNGKYYPEILLQSEFQPVFNVSANQSQTVVFEVFIPSDAPSGTYSGSVSVLIAGHQAKIIPIQATVKNFTHPNAPKMTVGFSLGYSEMSRRFYGSLYPGGSYQLEIERAHNYVSQMLHWYKLCALSSGNGETNYTSHNPRPYQQKWLDGTMFSAANKYLGPGMSTGQKLWFIGHYGNWDVSEGQGGLASTKTDYATIESRLNDWKTYFNTNFPDVECPWYIMDEPANFTQANIYLDMIANATGSAKDVRTLITGNLDQLRAGAPRLTRPMDWAQIREPNTPHDTAATAFQAQANTKLFSYNGKDFAGSTATEAEGIEFMFGMVGDYKLNSLHKFIWELMYYNDFQAGGGLLDVWDTESARTFGQETITDTKRGYRNDRYSNGDGVWIYTLEDKVNTSRSKKTKLMAPSYRLPCYSDGIQLVDVLDAAKAVDATAANAIADAINPLPRYKDSGGYTNPANTKSYSPDQYETWSEQLFAILGV
jgi:hypothetical protein